MSLLRSALLAGVLISSTALAQTPAGAGLPWSVFLGGTGFDEAEAWNQVHLARNGDVLVCGHTASADFPRTTGPGLQGVEDGFVVRLRNGQIVWAMLIGGNGPDAVRAVLEDGNGDVLIAGRTGSTNFPTTTGALQTTFGGGANHGDGFVARLGNAVQGPPTLSWSTYLGGIGDDSAVTLATLGTTVVAGAWTASTYFPFPLPAGAFQPAHAGPPPGPNTLGADGLVAVLDPSAQGAAQLRYATYLGGSGDDVLVDVAINGALVVVSGRTLSSDFPVTAGAFDTSLGGSQDAFIAALDPTLSACTYATHLGGNGRDIPYGMAITAKGEVVLGGETTSTDFPTTPGAFRRSYSGGSCYMIDGFLARLDLTRTGLAQLTWATYLGGSGDDAVMDLAVERSGIVTAVGLAASPTFQTTPGALQEHFQGGGGGCVGPADGFVVRLDPAGNGAGQLVYSTFLGGSQDQDNATDVALTATGGAVVVGWTRSANFPATGSYRGNSDAFVAELDMLPNGVVRHGAPSPACHGPLYLSVNSQPLPGNATFEILANEAPRLSIGALLFGNPAPGPIPVPGLGIDAWLLLPPLVSVTGSANGLGFARFQLSIPQGITWPVGSLGVQTVWVGTCAILVASGALKL